MKSQLNDRLRQMNCENREFWARQLRLLPQRMADEALAAITIERMQQEQISLPIYFQQPLDALAENAANHKKIILTSQGRKAGKANKTDALQQTIIQIVQQNMDISVRQLKDYLTRERYPELIDDMDDETISFVQPNGTQKSAKLSGLKDRLSRAKNLVRSQKPVTAISLARTPGSKAGSD